MDVRVTMDRHVALVGLPAVGKSSVARRLGRALGAEVIDLDAEIVRADGRTVERIFAEDGEAAFRTLERAALERVLARSTPVVLSCGGGVVLDGTNRDLLGEQAVVVWLDATDESLLRRMRKSRTVRPLMAGDDPDATLARLRAERGPLYEEIADIRVEVDRGDADTSTRSVLAALGTGSGSPGEVRETRSP
jgi:shikimate kinase